MPDDQQDVPTALGAALGGAVRDLRALSGGASRLTSAFELEAPGAVSRPLVLQQDRGGGTGFSSGVGVEAALLRAAASAGVPVPGVVAAGAWPGTGRGWLVTERLDGETIPRRILRDARWADARGALAAQCGTALAAVHRIDPDEIPGLPAHDPLRDPRPLLDALGSVRPVLELGVRWLARHRVASDRRTTVHGDFRLGNLLVGPEGLRGVLDWELAHVGDPAEDLGWLCARAWRFGGPGRVAGVGSLDDLLAAYVEGGGGDVEPERVRWWEAYASVRWAVICELQAAAHLSGAVRSVELAAIGRRVCESEWDLLLLMGIADDAEREAPPTASAVSAARSPFGRPTAGELLDAVRERLDGEAPSAGDGARFEARVVRNALGIVGRELELGPDVADRHASRLALLGVADDVTLAAALRRGDLDDELDRFGRLLAGSTRDQVLVASPHYLGSPSTTQ